MGKSSGGGGGGGGQNTVTQQSSPPSQFLNAYTNVTNQAQNTASAPLQQYGGSMVAGFTPQQSQAFDITQNLQGQYAPYLNAAAQSFGQATQPLWPSLPQFNTSGLPQGAATAINNAQQYGAAAAQPIAQQLYPYTETAMGAAQNLTSNAYPYAAIATQPINTQPYTGFGLGTAQNLPGQVSPYSGFGLGQAQNLGAQIAPSTGLAMGQAQSVPGAAGSYASRATGAAGSAPGLIGTYESPYTRQVTSALQGLFNQQNAQQLQQVRGSSVGQGAYGGDREAVAEALTAQQQQLAEAPAMAQALQQGYQSSVQAAQQQAALQAQTGLGAGQLATQAGLGAGQLGLGTAGALTQAGLGAGQLGISAGQLTSQTGLGAGQLGLGAGQLGLQGQLGQGQLGLGAGNLINQAGAQQGQLALGAGGLLSQGLTSQGQLGLGAGQLNLAAGQGLFNEFNTQQQQQLAAEQANAWLNSQAGFGLSSLGQESQNLGLAGAQALLGTGGMQQQLTQEQLNIPYEMFQQQQAYPYQATGWLANIAEGLGSSAGGTSSTSYPGASLGSQLGGLGIAGIGAAGLANQAGLFNGGLFGGGDFQSFGGGAADFSSASAADLAAAGFAHGGRVPLASGGLAAGGIPGFNMPSPTTPFQIPAGVPDASISVVPDSGGAAGRSSPVVSSFLKPSTTTTQTGGGGGGSSAASDAGLAVGAANVALKVLPLLFLRDGGRIGHQGGGLASGTPGSGFVLPPDATLTSQPNGLHLPQPAKIGLDSIIPPGPSVKTGSGPPRPPQGGPTAPGSQDLTPQQELQGLGQAVKLFNKPEGEARGGVVGIPHPHLGGGLADMSHLAKPAMGIGQHHEGFDVGGDVLPLTAVAPLSGTSPNAQTFYQQLTQMPLEQLREMSVRVPPTTQQGQMIQRALEAKEMTSGAGTAVPAAAPNGGLSAMSGQQPQGQSMGLASGAGNGMGGIGGYADGGAIPEDPDADPHPIVDHSGKTVVIHYPSEGKSLDLGIPSSGRKALQGGGSSGSSPQYTAQGAQALAQFYAQNPSASASDLQGTNLTADAGVLAGNLRPPDPIGPSAQDAQFLAQYFAQNPNATAGLSTRDLHTLAQLYEQNPTASAGSSTPAATGQSPGQVAQQKILDNALAPPPAQNPGFNITRPQAINPYANIQVPSAVNVGEATTPSPMNYLPLQTPQLNPASFLGTTNPSYYNNTAPGLPQLPIPGGINTGIGLPQLPVISGAHGGRARLQDGGLADVAQEISNETKEVLAESDADNRPAEARANLPPPLPPHGLAGTPTMVVAPSGGGLGSTAAPAHPDLETTRSAPGTGGLAAPREVPPDIEATRTPPGMGALPSSAVPAASSPMPSAAAKASSRYAEIPDYLQPLFEDVEGGESKGKDVLYGGKPVPPGNVIPGAIGPTGQQTHAFSEFQFQPDTWNRANEAARAQGRTLDKDNRADREWAALYTARADYKARTGRDLDDDAKAGNINRSALTGTWTSLGAGGGGAGGGGTKTGLAGRQDPGDPIINTGYVAPSQNGLAGNVSDSGLASAGGTRTQYEPGLGASPWLALVAAGLGTMAGRSPQGLVNLGQGGLEGVKVLGKQEEEKMRQAQIANEAENRQATLGIEQQRLTQTGQYQQNEIGVRMQEMRIRQQQADRELQAANQRFQYEMARAKTADDRAHIMEQHYADVAQHQQTSDSITAGYRAMLMSKPIQGRDPKTGELGNFVFSPEEQKFKFEPGATVGKQPAPTVFDRKREAYLSVHHGDEEGANQFAAGHKTMSPEEISRSAANLAQRDLAADPTAAILKPEERQAREGQLKRFWEGQIHSTSGAPTAAPSAAPATPAAAPPATPAASDISYLKAHPEMVKQFDARFGEGAAAKALQP